MLEAVSQINSVLQQNLNDAAVVASLNCHAQLVNVDRAVRLACEWMFGYLKLPAMKKFFKASKEKDKWSVAKQRVDESLRTLMFHIGITAATSAMSLAATPPPPMGPPRPLDPELVGAQRHGRHHGLPPCEQHPSFSKEIKQRLPVSLHVLVVRVCLHRRGGGPPSASQ